MSTVFRSLQIGVVVAGSLLTVATEGAEVVYVVAAPGWFSSGSLYARESIPYFAAHPPVYYSHVTPRAYGNSPYADLPAVRGTQAVPPPRLVHNAFAVDRSEMECAPIRPLRIRNPYVAEEPVN